MKKTYLLLLFLLALVSFGCQKNISLNLPKYDNKVVVFCVLQPDFPPAMSLTLSQSYYSYADTIGKPTYITNAQVIITDQNANTVDTLALDTFSQYNYYGKHRVVAGHHYIAKITYQGKIITAVTSVPMAVKIDSIDYVKMINAIGPGSIDTSYEFNIFFKDIPGEADYYTLTQSSKYTFNNQETVYNPFTSDTGIDGKQIEITTQLINYTPTTPAPTFDIYFNIDNANKETSDYFTNIYAQANNANNPFSQPIFVSGNINGGLGLFGAMTPSPGVRVRVVK